MKKIIFAFLPSVVALLYGVGQIIIYTITGHVYFSSVFAWELVIYFALSLVYIFLVFRTTRLMLSATVCGTIVGIIVFFFVGSLIFLKFGTFFSCEEDKGNTTEKLSSDGKHMAREYVENCGAVSDFETIFEVKNLISKESQQILNLKGESVDECDFSWGDEKTLKIECVGNRSVQIYNYQNEFGNVKIIFKLPDSFFMYDHPKPGEETEIIK